MPCYVVYISKFFRFVFRVFTYLFGLELDFFKVFTGPVWKRLKDLLPDHCDQNSIRERWDAARRNLRLAHDAVRTKYDITRKPVPFHTGDLVWLRNFLLLN
jgi:hypothetical protein